MLLVPSVIVISGNPAQAARALPDMVVVSVSMSPAKPAAGQAVIFSAVVKNQGNAATPSGVINGVGFSIDGNEATWSDTYTRSIAPGSSVTLTANNSYSGSAAWTAVKGSHSLQAWVNDNHRFRESNFNNNILVESFTVTTSGPSPLPSPSPSPSHSPSPLPSPTPSPTTTPIAGSCAPAPSSSTVVSVMSTGAKGNGSANDTAAIQAAVNQVAGKGGTVLVPAGTYMVDATVGVQLGSNMTFEVASGATIQVIANSAENYDTVTATNPSNLNIVGSGTIAGDRNNHQGSSGEWGMGVSIYGGSNVAIQGLTITNMWGDGIYLGESGVNGVKICNIVANNNRRQGISIVDGSNINVTNSVFENTGGTEPEAGMDIEPNTGDSVTNVTVSGSKFTNNAGSGMQIYAGAGSVSNVTMSNNVISGSGNNGGIYFYDADKCSITDNNITDSNNWGIELDGSSNNNTVTGNTIKVSGGASGSWVINRGSGNTISGNIEE